MRKKLKLSRKFLVKSGIFCLVFISFLFFNKELLAVDFPAANPRGEVSVNKNGISSIMVDDPSLFNLTGSEWAKRMAQIIQKEKEQDLGSKLFQSTLQTVLNTLAFDAANWIASGGKGQGTAFETRSFGQVVTDAVDSAAGEFLYQFGTQGPLGVNLCQPSIGVDIQIGLGLTKFRRPKPECTFSEMRDNWETELKRPDFLKRFQDYFQPTSNDLGIALNVHTMNLERLAYQKEVDTETYKNIQIGGGGFKPIESLISGIIKTPQGLIYEEQKEALVARLGDNIGKYTGDALIDALNIFINQLAIQLINRLLNEGLYDIKSGGAGIYNPQADVSGSGGIQAAKERFRKIIQPRFNVRGDYDILAELAMCPDQNPGKAGPTNCVITDNFRRAIQDKKTVGQAMEEGLLNPEGVFGFTAKNVEPRYVDEHYPYRSIIILRKFRILPAPWEAAALFINEQIENDFFNQVSLGEMVECFNPCDQYGEIAQGCSRSDSVIPYAWCQGLIDPNWVLKAPLNYCAREGYGPEILGEPQVSGDEYSIQRKDNYCADEQTCIKETGEGSCEVYGYCTQERRTWNFSASACEPLYNTCRTFSQRDGASVSYLENTLEFCDAGGVGCHWYSADYNYLNDAWGEQPDDRMYFNRNVEACDPAAEGCRQFIRAKAGLGTNLIPNSSFEEWNDNGPVGWALNATAANYTIQQSAEKVYGNSAVKIIALGEVESIYLTEYLVQNTETALALYKDHRYILSGYIKPEIKSNNGKVLIGVGRYDIIGGFTAETTELDKSYSGIWNRVYVDFIAPEDIPDAKIEIRMSELTGTPATDPPNPNDEDDDDIIYIDAVQLEEVIQEESPSVYSDYGDANVIHQKLLPDYLSAGIGDEYDGIQGLCYEPHEDSYRLLPDAPNECFNYARRCTEDEAGCDIFRRVWDGFAIPAKITPNDYCPAECDAYDMYIQQETTFESTNSKYLIPSTAKSCTAQADGCDEFTNLDEVAQGGEGIEYYSVLRQCTTNESNTAPFYVWEGTEDTGFQLRVFTLKYGVGANTPEVVEGRISEGIHVSGNNTHLCDEDIHNAPVGDSRHNPDCRQFYSRAGVLTYALFTKTITYSSNCHPYRRTEINIDPSITAKETCGNILCNKADANGQDKCWDANNGVCNYCKNRGKWQNSFDGNSTPDDGVYGACIYMAIPGEGVPCSSSQNGCRKYIGNVGHNIRNIITDDFDDGDASFWRDDLEVEEISVKNNGRSLYVNKDVIAKYTGDLTEGKSYLAEIMVKKENAGDPLKIGPLKIVNHPSEPAGTLEQPQTFQARLGVEPSGATALIAVETDDWTILRFYLPRFSRRALINDELQIISSSHNYYLDYIKLTEVTDNYYLIKNSWNIPTVCDQDWDGNTALHYMAGCYEYVDRDKQNYYLKSFSDICSESAAGCELIIDTQNSSSPFGAAHKATCRLDAFCSPTTSADSCLCEIIGPSGAVEVCAVSTGAQECFSEEVSNLDKIQLNNNIKLTRAVKVQPDSLEYVVFDPQKSCGSADKGCQRLGKPELFFKQAISWENVYLKNNPDRYNTILCAEDQIGCEEYRDSKGAYYYFNSPGDQVCDYRDGYFGLDWYKKKVTRCDEDNDGKIDHNTDGDPTEERFCLSGKDCGVSNEDIICGEDSDCEEGVCVDEECHDACILDDWDTLCPIDNPHNNTNRRADAQVSLSTAPKTAGFGGSGNRIEQPEKVRRCDFNSNGIIDADEINACLADSDCNGAIKCISQNWVGLCPAYESSCTEIIDPASRPAVNILFNSDFSQGNAGEYGWEAKKQYVKLEKNTLYKIKGHNNNLIKADKNCADYILKPDDNVLFAGDYRQGIGAQSRLFYSGEEEDCVIEVSNTSSGPVELKEAIINYQIADGLDYSSCNSEYIYEEGCILFNRRSINGSAGYEKLVYDVDGITALDSDTQSLPLCPDQDEDGVCDSNQTIKASHDRVCDKWLACKTLGVNKSESGAEEVSCYNIGLCDGLDENNQCRSWVEENRENLTAKINSQPANYGVDISSIVNLSGYGRVGAYSASIPDDAEFSPEGYLPYSQMKQVGNLAAVPNGSFEYFDVNGYPSGWESGQIEDDSSGNKIFKVRAWSENMAKIITSPSEGQNLQIDYFINNSYAIDGKNFVQLGSSFALLSELIETSPDTEYILTALVNTANLTQGTAKIKVYFYDLNDEKVRELDLISQPARASSQWQKVFKRFKTTAGEYSIKIILYAEANQSAVGNFYYDNIKLRPALEVREIDLIDQENDPEYWVNSQSCRLYPASEALSCEYNDSQDITRKGWYGYCLQYDRGPEFGSIGDSNACLQWWPVDRVKGDAVDQGVGYLGRYPLYYCMDSRELIGVPVDGVFKTPGMQCSKFNDECDGGRVKVFFHNGSNNNDSANYKSYANNPHSPSREYDDDLYYREDNDYIHIDTILNPNYAPYGYAYNCSSRGVVLSYTGSPTQTAPYMRYNGYDWYEKDGFVPKILGIEAPCYAIYQPPKETWPEMSICTEIIKVVSDTSKNKFWAGRVYKGSDYTAIHPLNTEYFEYDTDYNPFGSIIAPVPAGNPSEWIKLGDNSYRPLTIEGQTNMSRASQDWQGNYEGLQRIFARSYGYWEISSTFTALEDLCEGKLSRCRYGAQICDDTAPCNDIPGICQKVPDPNSTPSQPQPKYIKECEGGLNFGLTCSQDENCKPVTAGACTQNDENIKTCIGGNNAGAICQDNSNCDSNNCQITSTRSVKRCENSPREGNECGNDDDCWGFIPSTQCQLNTEKTFKICIDGSLQGMPCNELADCHAPNGSCVEVEYCKFNNIFSDLRCNGNNAQCAVEADRNTCEIDIMGVCKSDKSIACVLDKDCPAGKIYEPKDNVSWNVPKDLCYGSPPARPECSSYSECTACPSATCDYCGVPPRIVSVKIDGQSSANHAISREGFVQLEFNTQIDDNQEPMAGYTVIWGDGELTSISGVELRDRSNLDNPEKLYHLYDYWDLKRKQSANLYGIICASDTRGNYCDVQPKVWVKDNWGWYSDSNTWNTAPANIINGKFCVRGTDGNYISDLFIRVLEN